MSAESVAVVGGGLAGLAAAVALGESGLPVDLLEARRTLGGRASSFRDPATGETIDFCQHVSLGCCTNLADFCRRTGIDGCFAEFDTLHVLAGDGCRCDLTPSRRLPAPLHLLPVLLRMRYLPLADRLRIARAIRWLASPTRRTQPDDEHTPTMDRWLAAQGQSQQAIEGFWNVVLVSALGETLDRVEPSAARKVMVDGFLTSARAHRVLVPTVPLSELYGSRLETRLGELGVTLHLGARVRQIAVADAASDVAGPNERAGPPFSLTLADGQVRRYSALVVALPWWQLAGVLSPELRAALPEAERAAQLQPAPIAGVHLWFDRPITPLPHAVFVGRLSQWLFNPAACAGAAEEREESCGYYYQVVISAARELAERDRDEVLAHVCRELADVLPAAREAQLLRGQIVVEKAAVFSPRPGSDALRPAQRTRVPRLALAGDWTATGWPSTMEGAVRSGYLAAEAVLADAGRPQKFVVPDLPRGLLARWLCGR